MSVFVAISPEEAGTRILVTDRNEVKLKARLSSPPSHPRALQWLLEAIALWQGAKVHAVLYAGGPRKAYAARFSADWFTDFGGPLYTLEVVDGRASLALCDSLSGLGRFDDLKQLRLSCMRLQWDSAKR